VVAFSQTREQWNIANLWNTTEYEKYWNPNIYTSSSGDSIITGPYLLHYSTDEAAEAPGGAGLTHRLC